MEWYLWIILGVAVLACIPLVEKIVGRGMLLQSVGRHYLGRQLEQSGVRAALPPTCVHEISDRVTERWAKTARRDRQGLTWAKDRSIEDLQAEARLTAAWCRGEPGLEKYTDLVGTLKKHGVPFGTDERRSA